MRLESGTLASITMQEHRRPNQSYAQLIYKAISSAPGQKMILQDIYQYLMDNHEYFRRGEKGWKNSVRHALSASSLFKKRPFKGRETKRACHEWYIVGLIDSIIQSPLTKAASKKWKAIDDGRGGGKGKGGFNSSNSSMQNDPPITPSTIERPYKLLSDADTTGLDWTQNNSFSWNSMKKFTGISANPDFYAPLIKEQVTVGIETDGLCLWMPIPRDPLSDLVGLPIITWPNHMHKSITMNHGQGRGHGVDSCYDIEAASNDFISNVFD